MSRQSLLAAFFAVLYLVAMVAPDIYIHTTYVSPLGSALLGMLWWLPSAAIVATFAAAQLGIWHNTMFRAFFGLTLAIMFPKLLFTLLAVTMGWKVGLGAAAVLLTALLYGFIFGWRRIVVRTATCRSTLLPDDFDGYRIVHLSDLHIGTFLRNPAFIDSLADAVNGQHPDMVVFTGDLVNVSAIELLPFRKTLSAISAPDGVYSVMGNHDYCMYAQDCTHRVHGRSITVAERDRMLLQYMEDKMGWRMLMNENVVIKRGKSSIAVVGVENIGKPPFKSFGNLAKALTGLPEGMFKILLSHDPTHWRCGVLNKTDIALTLSGHTHAGQVRLGRFSPAKWAYNEWGGSYVEGNSMLHVSPGIGGTVPFRFGAWPEINVVVLKKK
ncbi:MAG: metallophosphoesterase [Prevotella sp.]|nr:metallophosphoesterase [Prevotella sp.]